MSLPQYFQKSVAKTLGCVPIYFKQAVKNQENIKECHTKKELRKAQFIIDNYDKFLDTIEKPCDEMLVLTIDSIDSNPSPRPKDIAIKFIYTEKVYEDFKEFLGSFDRRGICFTRARFQKEFILPENNA